MCNVQCCYSKSRNYLHQQPLVVFSDNSTQLWSQKTIFMIKIKHQNLKTTVNNSLKFSVTFRQQLLSSSNCCLLSSARDHHREQQIVVDVAQLVSLLVSVHDTLTLLSNLDTCPEQTAVHGRQQLPSKHHWKV